MRAVAAGDLSAFDRQFWSHIGFIAKNAVRALVLGLTDGLASRAPVEGATARSFQRLSRMSAAFALVADVAMGSLGGSLKRREKLCGRLADALSWLYLASAALKRFQEEGAAEVDAPCARWCCEHALHQVQEALVGFLRNFPNRILAGIARLVVFPLGARYAPPSDALGGLVAKGLLEDAEGRRRLTGDLFVPPRGEPGLGQLEEALEKVVRARPAQQKLKEAVKSKRLTAATGSELAQRAAAEGIIDADELRLLQEAEKARERALVVDSFPFAEYAELRG
jgi:acyl-CoA dehydrogenase